MGSLLQKLFLSALLVAHTGLSSASVGTPTPAAESSKPAAVRSSFVTLDIPYEPTYDPTAGGIGLFISKNLFEVQAPPNYALTGKMGATINALYSLGDATEGDAYMDITFDVLLPHCDFCGPFASDLVSTGRDGLLTRTDGGMQFVANESAASGMYSRVLVYNIVVASLPAWSGYIQFQSMTFTAETVALPLAASPVPELPPAALFGLGLFALGIAARAKSRKRLPDSAASK